MTTSQTVSTATCCLKTATNSSISTTNSFPFSESTAPLFRPPERSTITVHLSLPSRRSFQSKNPRAVLRRSEDASPRRRRSLSRRRRRDDLPDVPAGGDQPHRRLRRVQVASPPSGRADGPRPLPHLRLRELPLRGRRPPHRFPWQAQLPLRSAAG